MVDYAHDVIRDSDPFELWKAVESDTFDSWDTGLDSGLVRHLLIHQLGDPLPPTAYELTYTVAARQGYQGVAWRLVSPSFDGRAQACMVGDDRIHQFDYDELQAISEEDYCPDCGQIGCEAMKG